jgi:hypothetical protein
MCVCPSAPIRDSLDPTHAGRLRLPEPTVSGLGGAAVPPPRGAGPPVLPPRESGMAAGSRYAEALPRQQRQQRQPQQQQRRGQGRRDQARGAGAAGFDARDAAVERAMALLRADALQQRYTAAARLGLQGLEGTGLSG